MGKRVFTGNIEYNFYWLGLTIRSNACNQHANQQKIFSHNRIFGGTVYHEQRHHFVLRGKIKKPGQRLLPRSTLISLLRSSKHNLFPVHDRWPKRLTEPPGLPEVT